MLTSTPPREQAMQYARQKIAEKPVFLDTETTGLDRDSEIVEIAIIDWDGCVLLDTLVRPSRPIPAEASRIHHIHNEMVQSAPTWPALWPTIRSLLLGRPIGIYNAEFDLRMMQQSHLRYRLPWRENLNAFCVLQTYANYRAEWDGMRRAYRRFSLEHACRGFQIAIPKLHRAKEDTQLTRLLLHKIAGLPASPESPLG